jgi:hypothetical protein
MTVNRPRDFAASRRFDHGAIWQRAAGFRPLLVAMLFDPEPLGRQSQIAAPIEPWFEAMSGSDLQSVIGSKHSG